MFSCLNCKNASPKILKPLSGTPFNYLDCLLCKKTIYQFKCSCGNDIFSLDPFFFGKKIFCKKCDKNLNIVPCPKCKQINMWNGNYSMGSSVTCLACKNNFQHVACPFCSESNFWNVDYTKNYFYKPGVSVQCYKCLKSFQHITCPCCISPIYFKENNLWPGKAFPCEKCKTDLVHVRCRKCSFNEFFKREDNFIFGKNYSCKNCKAFYTIFPCLTCKKASNILLSENQSNILKFSCSSKACQEFYLYQCKRCSLFSDYRPNFSGCTKEICKLCEKANPIYFCTKCKKENFCECSINNDSKHGCSLCQIEVKNSKVFDSSSSVEGFCIFDLTRKIDTVFVPCGHACYCNICYRKLQAQGKDKCPYCNEKKECIKLFL